MELVWNDTLVQPNHPVLRSKADIDPFTLDIKWPIKEQDLFKLMHDKIGIGLASPQLGNPVKMFVMTHSEMGDIGVYNPEILETSEETILMEEGCLSFPGLFVSINRPEKIKVKFLRSDGKTEVETWLSGMDSRCFQHEYDHLQGILHVSLVSDFKLQRAIKKRDKLLRKFQRAMR